MPALPNFRIETLETRSGITIKLGGELDSATCDQLVSHFDQLAGRARVSDLVLDLSEVSFIDSSGMRAIILIERGAGERGFGLTILPPPESLTDLFALTGIADRAPLGPQAGDAAPAAPFVERIELTLPREPTAPARARAELREAFGGRIGDADRATITLLTSELVTNAVIHPDPQVGGSIGLRITAYSDRVRVEISDAGAGFDAGDMPARRRPETGGHGLVVVDGLSSRWGARRVVIDAREGFSVWFELDIAYDLLAMATEGASASAGAGAGAPKPDEPEVATAEG